jgi:hypothetical protein
MGLQLSFCTTEYLTALICFARYYCGNQVKDDETKRAACMGYIHIYPTRFSDNLKDTRA